MADSYQSTTAKMFDRLLVSSETVVVVQTCFFSVIQYATTICVGFLCCNGGDASTKARTILPFSFSTISCHEEPQIVQQLFAVIQSIIQI